MSKVKTRSFFCGGAGLTAGVELQDLEGVCFFDTCDKDLVEAHNLDNVFITDGTRGGGKNRAFIMPKVKPQVPPFLEKFPGGDFNIAVFGLGGASGSTGGPLVVQKLAGAGETVVAVVIGGIESTEVIDNTINTLKTLEGIAANTDTPIIIHYIENVNGVPHATTNKDVEFAVRALYNLSSQNNRKLDVTDVDNWARFNRKHPIAPQLCQLHIFDNRQEAAAVLEPIAVASLYLDPAKEVAYGSPFVRTVGHPNDADNLVAEQLHFVINTVGIEEIIKGLNDHRAIVHRQQQNFKQRAPIIDIDDNRTDDGFVL